MTNLETNLLRRGSMSLYDDEELLGDVAQRLISSGYESFVLDLADCRSVAAFHERAAAALRFPAYYGHNMDAFGDSLLEMELGDSRKGVVVLTGISGFARLFPEQFQIVLRDFAKAARLYLITGTRLVIVIGTDDKFLQVPEVGCYSITRNLRAG